MLENLHLESFSEHLNSKFLVRRENGPATELQLIEAGNVGQAAPGHEQFSLIFRGSTGSFLEQSIYSFEHDKIGTFEMFIVPIRREQEAFLYQAIINRPV